MNGGAVVRSMAVSAVLLSVSAVLVWVAWRSLHAAGHDLRRLLRLRRALARGFRSIGPGPVALRGQVQPPAEEPLLRSPMGNGEGVYLAYSLDSWDGTTGAFAMAGAGGKWVRTEQDEVAIPFALSDGESTVLVDPEGAEVLLPERTSYPEPTGRARYRESLLAPGTEVVVIGTAAPATGTAPDGPYRGHSSRTVVAGLPAAGGSPAPERRMLVTTSQHGQRRLLSRIFWRMAAAIPAPLLLAVSAWQILAPSPVAATAAGGAVRCLGQSPRLEPALRAAHKHGKISAPQVIYDWPKRPRF